MKKSEMAVAVAKDVLAQLRKRKNPIIPRKGVYFLSDYRISNELRTDQIQKHLPALQENNCRVCALGAVFMSKIRLYNNVKIDDVIYDHRGTNNEICLSPYKEDISEVLSDIFSESQLDMIESAFELSDMTDDANYECPQKQIRDSILFGKNYSDVKARMRAIMQNIVDNNGKFSPPSTTRKQYEDFYEDKI